MEKLTITTEQMRQEMQQAGFVVDIIPAFGYYSATNTNTYIEAKGGINRLYRRFKRLVDCPKCGTKKAAKETCTNCLFTH